MTATSPSGRQLWRAARGPVAIGVVIVVVAVVVSIVTPNGPSGVLDPDAVDPSGSHALAALLHDRGIAVTKVTTVDEAAEAAESGSTLLVTQPALVPSSELARLADAPNDLVVLAPGEDDLTALGLPVDVVGNTDVKSRKPGCQLRAANLAGSSDLGGLAFRPRNGDAVGCYLAGGDPTLLQFADRGRTVTLVGSGAAWTNDRLGRRGNAALGLNILGAQPELTWLVPSLAGATVAGGERSLVSLLPHRVRLAAWQLGIALVLLALWRARRLGPVVYEPLPVVVRAAETVEGRARLYRASRSRGRAAEALRTATIARLAPSLGLPGAAEPDAVVAAVARRSSRNPAAVDALLYGAAPDSEAALVQLASDLDDLDREVRTL